MFSYIKLYICLCLVFVTMKNTLRLNIHKWQSIGASETVLQWLQEGVKFPLSEDICAFEINNGPFSKRESVFLESEIARLLLQGYIEVCDNKPLCVSPITCVPKKNGDFRLVTDLRFLNSHCEPPKFKYEDINSVIKITQPKDYMITADLKDGFHHIPVHKDHQLLLGFKFKSIYYTWSVLPFGHNCSPYYFTKILRPVVTYLRSVGLRIVLYVDDFILFARDDTVHSHKVTLLTLLEDLGWVVNVKKSSLEPSLKKEFIGYLIDNSGDKTVIKIPQCRITKLRKDISRCLKKGRVSARGLARIGGQCISMYKCIFPAKLQLRSLYRLLRSKESWSDILYLDNSTIEDLVWWHTSLAKWNGLVLQDNQIDIQMKTDASSIAWGAWIPGHQAQGFWNKRMSYQHSNYREMSAVWLGLISLKQFLMNKTVQVLSDNVTTVAFINNMGGPSQPLNEIARLIHQEAINMNVKIVASYLAGPRNWKADQLSRLKSTYEWKLHPNIFRLIDQYWGPHQVDRFASMLTTQLPHYNSLYWDPLSAGVNALAQKDWTYVNNYVNAPFGLLSQVLEVIQSQRASATIIAPWWEGQIWFQKLKSLLIDSPIPLPVSHRTVLKIGPKAEPLKNKAWKLYAWRISGNPDYGL